MTKLKKLYKQARLAYSFIKKEFSSPSPMSLLKRFTYLLRGHHSHAVGFYNLDDYSLNDYFSDWAELQTMLLYDHRNIQAGYQYGLNNKIFSTAILGNILRVPSVYAIIEHGKIFSLTDRDKSVISRSWMESCQNAGGKIVFKPITGARGEGIFILSVRNGVLYFNDRSTNENEIQEIVQSLDEIIIIEYMQQGKYASSLYPQTANTIRTVTIIDPDNGEPYMPYAIQRVGTKASHPVDNWSHGGIRAVIDLKSGILGKFEKRGKGQKLIPFEKHPDTDTRLQGLQVPHWDRIKNDILNAAARLAYFKSLTWDLVILDDGIAALEADTFGVDQFVVPEYPLLRDDRMRRFFEYYGIIHKR